MAIQAKIGRIIFRVGDTVAVHYKIIEREVVAGKTKKEKKEEQKERTQPFIGIVIAIRGGGEGQSFVVRRIGIGAIGIERIFPVHSPWIKKIVVQKRGDVRRAKLYYLRTKVGKAASKLKTKTAEEVPGEVENQGDVTEDKKPETAVRTKPEVKGTESTQKPSVVKLQLEEKKEAEKPTKESQISSKDEAKQPAEG